MAVLTKAHTHTSCFSFRCALRDKLLRKLHSVTGPQHQTSATCNAIFSTTARQVAEKIAQCNRALTQRHISLSLRQYHPRANQDNFGNTKRHNKNRTMKLMNWNESITMQIFVVWILFYKQLAMLVETLQC